MSDKISCCLIIRDEASTLAACLESIRPHVDEIVVVDTGSTDDSPSIVARFADKFEVWTGCNDEQGRIVDFAAARNRSFELASHDWVCWADGDDVVVGAPELRKLVSGAASGRGGAVQFLMPYEYKHDALGRCVEVHMRERLSWPRRDFVWQLPVHEGYLPRPGVKASAIPVDGPRWIHRTAESKKPREPGRNLRILKAAQRVSGEGDVRALYYLGLESIGAGEVGAGIQWLRRHIELATPRDEEKMLALLELSNLYQSIGDLDESVRWALQATITKTWPEAFWSLGKSFALMAEAGREIEFNYRRAARYFELGLELDATPHMSETVHVRDPRAKYEAHACNSVALHRLGELGEAIKQAELALAGTPEHEVMRENLAKMRLEQTLAGLSKLDLPEHSKRIVEATLRGDFTVERAPVKPSRQGAFMQLKKSVIDEANKAQGYLDIIFFIGHQLEPWTPRTLEANGMGGSETMAWEMAKRLADLGHRVRVYAHTTPPVDRFWQGHLLSKPEKEEWLRVFDNVEWFDQAELKGDEQCDVLICSRNPTFATLPIRAAARVLWVHDVHCGDLLTPMTAVHIDLIWCLSNWHREFFLQNYPWLAPAKVEVTRNGIDPQRFVRTDVVRDPHRAIYSSSPDRGLLAAVQAWPAVRAAIPDAELHVFYGFENWERSLALIGDHPDPHCNREALNQLKMAIAKTKGIVLRGRVNGTKLAEEMLAASVWVYPTWFSETSCITAMEAQQARLHCVCPPLAALAETVLDHEWTGDVTTDTLRAFRLEGAASCGEDWSLDTLAQEWQRRLTQLARDARANVVPRFLESAQ